MVAEPPRWLPTGTSPFPAQRLLPAVQVARRAWRAILEKELYQGPTLSRSPSLLRSSTVALAINAGDLGLPAAAALHFGVSQSVHAVANYLFHDLRGAAIIAGPPALLRSL